MGEVLSLTFLSNVLAAAVRAGTPLLYVTIGEIISQRAGVLNLGLEGLMLIGALSSFMATFYTGSAWIGLLVGCLAAGALSLLHAFLCITLRADQVISGIMLVLLGIGLTDFVGVSMVGRTIVGRFDALHLPLLADIPYLGPILFQHDVLVYLAMALVPLAWVFLFKTRLGLSITAVGESPQTADTLGLSVYRIRYLCVFLGGLLAGAGGAYIALAVLKSWQALMTGGRGWIAVALVIFSFWRPQRAIWGAYLFGGIEGLQLRLQAAGVAIPVHLMSMMPYLATVLVLVFTARGKLARRLGAPAALTQPYQRGGA
ncbi:MAG: ABC transporter permease [Deinococcus sp.]|nr:ABC transporter permease [Deinococcus sp.]